MPKIDEIELKSVMIQLMIEEFGGIEIAKKTVDSSARNVVYTKAEKFLLKKYENYIMENKQSAGKFIKYCKNTCSKVYNDIILV